MTGTIKLTKNDFDFIHWEKDSGQEKETFELMIYGKSESNCNEIKRQILKHCNINHRLEKEIDYATWKIEQYVHNPGYAELKQKWIDALAVLKMIKGTNSLDPAYDLEFEKTLGDKK